MHAFHFGPTRADAAGAGRMLGIYHAPRTPMRGLLLMCPPLLHEQMRSYRFFSLLADRFAAAGIACLRFDYRGTGDSDGEDVEFSPAAAPDDIVQAAAALREYAGIDRPLVVMGVRASAMFATAAAAAARADALWWWLPVTDGRRYVDTLDARYQAELASPNRYPSRGAPAPVGPDDLLGFRVSPSFRTELANHAIDTRTALPPVSIIDGPDRTPIELPGARHHTVPVNAVRWADEIDLNSLILLRDVEPVVQALLDEVACLSPGIAHG